VTEPVDERSASGHAAPGAVAARPTRRRSPVLKLALLPLTTLLLFLVLEGAASLVLACSEAWTLEGDANPINVVKHCEYDPDLGWMNVRGLRVEGMYGPGTTFTTNSRGFRGLAEHAPAVPAGTYRVVCLGDSFTMGSGVGDDATFPAQLAALGDGLEAVNMGLGGFGIDQDYLWYLRDGLALEADMLLFAFIASDFNRMLSDAFLDKYPKPVLRVVDGGLVVGNVPAPRWFGQSRAALRWRALGQRFATTRALRRLLPAPAPSGDGLEQDYRVLATHVFDALHRLCRERGQAFVLVYFPTLYEGRRLEGRGGHLPPMPAWVGEYARDRGIPFIDFGPVFREFTPRKIDRCYLDPDPHFSAHGNRVVAQHLLRRLPELVPGFPGATTGR
jgi:hypothetical protein